MLNRREDRLVPVLALIDPLRGIEMLREVFGFEDHGDGQLSYGDLTVVVRDAMRPHTDLLALRMDHLALRVPDIAAMGMDFPAKLGKSTPDGPREISEFWTSGVRFVFFDGPEKWPIEFCMRLDGSVIDHGLDHFGIRTPDVGLMANKLAGLGAEPVAHHRLGAVDVQFMKRTGQMFEIFDEMPFEASHPLQGWVGFLST